jgi:sporulation protein YlmC with PRC-barrel domain
MITKERHYSPKLLLLGFIALVCSISLSIPVMAVDVKESKTEKPFQAEQTNPQKMMRASKMIDQLVFNEQGEEIGEVDDLIMSRQGKIKKVILSVGGFLGIGDKLVAVPFRSLKISDEGRIVYNVSREQLENHRRFSYRREGLYGYYYEPFYPMRPYGARREYRYPPSPPYGEPYAHFPPRGKFRGEFGPWEWEYFPERLRVSVLLGRGILNNKGEEVAELDDLMIGPEGRVEQIILDAGGFFGIDEKLVAVPFRPLKITDLGIVYNLTEEQLEKSPAFSYEKKNR